MISTSRLQFIAYVSVIVLSIPTLPRYRLDCRIVGILMPYHYVDVVAGFPEKAIADPLCRARSIFFGVPLSIFFLPNKPSPLTRTNLTLILAPSLLSPGSLFLLLRPQCQLQLL